MKLEKGAEYKIVGYRYRWDIVDTQTFDGKTYHLMESSIGDECEYAVVKADAAIEMRSWKREGTTLMLPTIVDPDNDIICFTYDDIQTALEDEGII